jgi:hypothetical protein
MLGDGGPTFLSRNIISEFILASSSGPLMT